MSHLLKQVIQGLHKGQTIAQNSQSATGFAASQSATEPIEAVNRMFKNATYKKDTSASPKREKTADLISAAEIAIHHNKMMPLNFQSMTQFYHPMQPIHMQTMHHPVTLHQQQ